MNCLRKELVTTQGKARMYQFYNCKSNKIVSYKVYDSHRKLIVTTDDYDYAEKVLMDKGGTKNEH